MKTYLVGFLKLQTTIVITWNVELTSKLNTN